MGRLSNHLFERRIGFHLYGLAAAALGLVGIVWGDFALVWQPVPAGVPGRTMLAYITGAALLSAGAAMQWRRTAVLGSEILTVLYALGVLLLHVPLVTAHPMITGTWLGLAEQLALVAGGLVAYASARIDAAARIDATGRIDAAARIGAAGRIGAAPAAAAAARLFKIGRVTLGLCLVVFGLAHFVYVRETAAFVPQWLPPNQIFWAYATGIFHWAAGAAILSGIFAVAAARWLTAMFVGFGVLVHAPSLFADPHSHMNWAANAMNLALIGAAWVIAESLATPPRNFSGR